MKEVRWTETAKKTLRETSDFILELWNSQINENFLDQLEYRIGQIQHNRNSAHHLRTLSTES